MSWFRSKGGKEEGGSASPTSGAGSTPFGVYCDPGATEDAQEAAYVLIRGGLVSSVAEVLEPAHLGAFLSSENGKVRARAALCLASLLDDPEALATALSPRERRVVADFAVSRCTDAPSTAACVQVLTALLKWSPEDGVAAAAAKVVLGGELHVPAHAQKVRQLAWDLIARLLPDAARPDVRKALEDAANFAGAPPEDNAAQNEGGAPPASPRRNGDDDDDDEGDDVWVAVVEGFAAAIAGEKDPRCLLRALRCGARLGAMMTETSSSAKTVESQNQARSERALFESLAPYFPISFAPPEHDPYNISPELLRTALREAICTSNAAIAAAAAALACDYVDQGEDEDAELDEACAACAAAAGRAGTAALLAPPMMTGTTGGGTKKEEAPLATRLGLALTADLLDAKRAPSTAAVDAVAAVAARCASTTALWHAFFDRGLWPMLRDSALTDAQIESVSGRKAAAAVVEVAKQGPFCWSAVIAAVGPPLCAIFKASEISGRRRAALATLAGVAAAVADLGAVEVVFNSVAEKGDDDSEGGAFGRVKALVLAACADSDHQRAAAPAVAALAARGSKTVGDEALGEALAALCRSGGAGAAAIRPDVGRIAASRPAVAARIAASTTNLNALAALCAAQEGGENDNNNRSNNNAVIPVFLGRCLDALNEPASSSSRSPSVAVEALHVALALDDAAAATAVASALLEDRSLVHALATVADPKTAADVAHEAARRASREARAACLRDLEKALGQMKNNVGGGGAEAAWLVFAAVLCALDCEDVTPALAELAGRLVEETTAVDETATEGARRIAVEAIACRGPKAVAASLVAALERRGATVRAARIVVVRGDDRAAYDHAVAGLATASADVVRAVLADDRHGARAPARSAASRFWRQRLYGRLAPALVVKAAQDEADARGGASGNNNNPPPTRRGGGGDTARALCALALAAPESARAADAASLVETAVLALETAQPDASTGAAALLDRLLVESADAVAKVAAAPQRACDTLLRTAQTHTDPEVRRDALRALGTLGDRLTHSQLYPFRAAIAKGLRLTLDDDLRAIRCLAAKVRNDWLVKVGGSIT